MSDATAEGPFVFQIGFNRCATGALFKLFQNSGVPSLHHCGRRHRKAGDYTLLNQNPQKIIDRNIRHGRPPVEGLEKYRAFFDMEFTDPARRIENYRHFARFAEAYPDALFIMNVRDKDAWLKSRIAHNDGKYLRKLSELYNVSHDETVALWAEHFERHVNEVVSYFGPESPRLLWFDIDRDPVEKVVTFVRPWYALDTRRWKLVHQTDWGSVFGSYAESLHRTYAARYADGPSARPVARLRTG